MRSGHAALVLCLLVAQPALAQTGYVYGADHCFHFRAPAGWTMDSLSGASVGAPMVFYPNGSSWQSAPDAMYARVASFKRGPSNDANKIRQQVASVLEMYRLATPPAVLSASKVQDLKGAGGESGELWRFVGYPSGAEEQVAYFVGRQTVNFFVLQLSRSEPSPPSAKGLLALAATYRERRDCAPCATAGSCAEKTN